ncbi:MAG: MBL fold metallo-hydrolase [Dehalococcoidales bacterium]|nr:MAG: MBL fold metallo-hydrolase [Dehalococcoidales bacterium]
MKLDITTLSENTAASPGILAEWGLSVLIETDTSTVLFDSGQSISASHNADVFRIDLGKINKIVLSHGHFDHTGGLKSILSRIGKDIEIIGHPDIWAAKCSYRPGREARNIGIPFSPEVLESHGARFNLTKEPVKIDDDIMTTGEIPMVTGFEEVDANMYVNEGEDLRPDQLLDDQALIINTESGLVVILGCAHRGIINTLYHAKQLTGVEKINTVIGGCHLMGATEERIMLTIASLKELGVSRIGVSHCTGLPAAAIMAREMGDSFFFNNSGKWITLQ